MDIKGGRESEGDREPNTTMPHERGVSNVLRRNADFRHHPILKTKSGQKAA